MNELDEYILSEVQGDSDLSKLDRKTEFFGGQAGAIYRSWSGGRHRILGGVEGGYCYHTMSRTAGGLKLFGDVEKEALRKIMRLMARFTGVQVLTWAAMDNHFHLLLRVPSQEKYLKRFEDKEGEAEGAGEERLLKHLEILYSDAYVAQVRREIASMRKHGLEGDVQKFLDRYRVRFCNLSSYMKEVKERFSRWYNKRYERKGTLWMDRFKSVLVEDGNALRTMAAYIDLNAVRAGIVEDPKDYRWCGYAEAVAGSRVARRGLCRVMQVPQDSWDDIKKGRVNRNSDVISENERNGKDERAEKEEVQSSDIENKTDSEKREELELHSAPTARSKTESQTGGACESKENITAEEIRRGSGAWYRCWLMRDGKEVIVDEKNRKFGMKARKGIPKEIVEEALAQEGKLGMPELLRCKIRYFSEGIALGGKEFVDSWYEKNREYYSPNREKGAKQIKLDKLKHQESPNTANPQTDMGEKNIDSQILFALKQLYSLKGQLSANKGESFRKQKTSSITS